MVDPGRQDYRQGNSTEPGIGVSSTIGRTRPRIAPVALLLAALVALMSSVVAPPVRAAGVAPKVVLIVGPAGGATPSYRRLADEAAAAAAKLTTNVVKVYSPDATWPNVKAALKDASVVVYLGHGNGWPS